MKTANLLTILMCAVLLLFRAALAANGDVTTVNVFGTLVDAPECTVNGNNAVDVDFGDEVIIRRVDGLNYKKMIIYALSCNSIAANGMKVAITGTPATFGSGLISAGKTGLAIQLWNGSEKLANATPVNFTYPDTPELYATPVAQDNLSLTAGIFSSTATLVVSYQ